MNFASITFVYYFLPLVVVLYYLCPNRRSKNIFLLLASLVFYSWGEGTYLAILIGSILFNHAIATRITQLKAQFWLALGIIGNLTLLVIMKYFNWLGDIFSFLKTTNGSIHLPLGISFFTFQSISMLIDIFRGQKKAESVLDAGLYIALFPQLIAGPIVRFNEIRDDIYNRSESLSRFSSGAFIFAIGLAQKVLLADTLSISADSAFDVDPTNLSWSAAWFGVFCFSLQIYYDFAGYSNMAIGIGRFFGFELPQNFNFPYSSASFREFWRRWHITLSRWFRDYLYIPMGGSRLKSIKTYRNLLIVFILCGLWHGAAWTFLLWGLWHGFFLILERVGSKLNVHVPRLVGMLYVWIFVSLSWVLFRADNISHALLYWKALFPSGFIESPVKIDITNTVRIAFFVSLLCMWDGWKNIFISSIKPYISKYSKISALFYAAIWGSVIVFYILSFFNLAAQTHSAFIYFRF